MLRVSPRAAEGSAGCEAYPRLLDSSDYGQGSGAFKMRAVAYRSAVVRVKPRGCFDPIIRGRRVTVTTGRRRPGV